MVKVRILTLTLLKTMIIRHYWCIITLYKHVHNAVIFKVRAVAPWWAVKVLQVGRERSFTMSA